MLLAGQAADVADQEGPVGRERVVERGRAVPGVEAVGVDPVGHHGDAVDALGGQGAGGRAGEGEVDVRAGVDAPQPFPHQVFERGQVVGAGVGGQVGLPDRDRGRAGARGVGRGPGGVAERGGQVDEVGPVAPERLVDRPGGQAGAEAPVGREGQGGDVHHRVGAAGPGPGAGGRCDDHGVESALVQVVGGAGDRSGDAVDLRRE